MVNESLLGALQSALARKQDLQKAMRSLYNAGYEKKEIEEAAKVLHYQIQQNPVSQKTMQQKNLKPAFINKKPGKQQAPETQINLNKQKQTPQNQQQNIQESVPQENKQNQQQNISPQNPSQQDPQVQTPPAKNLQKNKSKQKKPFKLFGKKPKRNLAKNKISNYGNQPTSPEAQQVQQELISALQNLKNIKIPSKIQFVNPQGNKPPIINQKISGYNGKPPKQVSKFATAALVTLLVILLGALVTVFFFKEELIQIFNNLNLK